MFLSELRVNETRIASIRLLQSDERIHAVIMKSNCGDRPLWRLDERYSGKIIYVYSQERPDFTGFVEQYGWPLQSYDHTVRTVDFSTLSTNLEDGQEWFFQVTLNPTIKSHGDIIPLIKDQSDAWVVRKLSPVADIVSDSLHLESSRKTSFKKGDHRVTIRKSVYRGKLIITHKDEFIKMIANGIGRSKAYGCGLLTISR